MNRFKKKHKSKPIKKRAVLKQMQATAVGGGYMKAPASPSQFSDDIGVYANTPSLPSLQPEVTYVIAKSVLAVIACDSVIKANYVIN